MNFGLEFARLIDATPEEVFDAFTSPEGQEVLNGQDDPGWVGTKLEFTFEPTDGKTLMTMAQRGFPTAELRDEHRRGLPIAFARLSTAIASKAS